MKSYSQYNQDIYILENIFNYKKDGYFVDIGAWDGIELSNSKALEDFGWNGVCIEPLPEQYELLQKNRTCECYNFAIDDVEGVESKQFLQIEGYSGMLSGLKEKYHHKHKERIDREMNLYSNEQKTIEVQVTSFNHLIKHKNIDFLSLDTEGSEYDILRSIDFSTYDIGCLTVENNYRENGIKSFLEDKGYKLICMLGCDELYVKVNR